MDRDIVTALLQLSGETDSTDERILNVLRRTDEVVLATSSVTAGTDLKKDAVRNRLKALEERGRVRSQRVGGGTGTLVWALAPDERADPVVPEHAHLFYLLDEVRALFRHTRYTGLYFIGLGVALMFLDLTNALTAVPLLGDPGPILVAGYGLAAAGGATWAFGGGVQLATLLVDRTVTRRLSTGRTRAQADAQTVLGLGLFALVAVPLASALADFWADLSASPLFSSLEAGFVAIWLFMAVLAALLSAGRR